MAKVNKRPNPTLGRYGTEADSCEAVVPGTDFVRYVLWAVDGQKATMLGRYSRNTTGAYGWERIATTTYTTFAEGVGESVAFEWRASGNVWPAVVTRNPGKYGAVPRNRIR